MSDADVPRDPWGNPVPDGVRPPNHPPASQDPPPPPPAWSPPPADAPAASENPAWPGRTPAAAPPPPPPPSAWPAPQGSWPAPPPTPDRPRVAGPAVAALVCGIASIGCTGFLGIVLGPVALGLGLRARRTIAASNGWRTGEGMATAGIVCGIIGTILSIVYLVFLVRNPSFITDFLNDLTTTTTTSGKLQGA